MTCEDSLNDVGVFGDEVINLGGRLITSIGSAERHRIDTDFLRLVRAAVFYNGSDLFLLRVFAYDRLMLEDKDDLTLFLCTVYIRLELLYLAEE